MQEVIKTAIRAILVNKTRAFLTMLGVVIGVFSVVTLSAIGNGVSIYISEQFEALGSNSLFVEPGNFDADDEGGMSAMAGVATGLARNLEDEIESFKQYVKYAAPIKSVLAKVDYRRESKKIMLIGSNEHILDLMAMRLEQGRGFDKNEVRDKKMVAVLGSKAVGQIFGQSGASGAALAINKKIKINERTFTVIGVLAEKGGGMGMSYDDMIYLPLGQVLDFAGETKVDEFGIKVHNKSLVPEAKKAIQARLREVVKDGEVSVMDQAQMMEMIDSIMGVLTAGLAGIAAISLLVGGIGIMNIMLVSVTERTKEIGLRRALGATPGVILTQFLFEALFLSVTGGLIGVILAWVTTLFLQGLFPATVSVGSVVLALTVSLTVGLIFGVAPARRAAKLSPIEALRYE
jgi:putative ABC transport system permease protein